MSKRLKMFILVVCTAAAVLFALFAYFGTKGPAVLASKLPLPSGSDPYVVFETAENYYPVSLSALLTEGPYAVFREGSAGNQILSVAKTAKECAVLVEDGNEGVIDIYAVMRLLPEDISSLSKGVLPKSWKMVLRNADIKKNSENDSWEIKTTEADTPLYYATERDIAIIAHDSSSFLKMLNISSGSAKSIPKNYWEKEKSWPAHIEISEGGLMFADDETKPPLILKAAWRSQEPDKKTGKAGEAVWKIEGLDKRISPLFLNALKSKTWDTSNCIIPKPLLLSAGMNLPELKGGPEEWPFPLETIGELGESMGLSEKQIKKILSGETIFSVGGYNKLLWFTLPGIMAEFTGDKELMRELVDAFWARLFFGAEPKPLEGFDFGGTTNVPFSVVGAGRGNLAVLGLLSPESIRGSERLESFMENNKKAIGWIVADLPKIGAALSDMTKINIFMNDSAINDEQYYEGDTDDLFQQDSSFSPFDQGISDSFGNVLKRMGKTLIVWETAESGSVNWYKNSK
ncbi:MAG: hypothetical protein GX672_01225 [Synergistaceae bacterium]|nr:hypothetical protein [Synergistaceae bacterium]